MPHKRKRAHCYPLPLTERTARGDPHYKLSCCLKAYGTHKEGLTCGVTYRHRAPRAQVRRNICTARHVVRYGLVGRGMYGCPETPLKGSDRCKSHPRENPTAADTATGDFPDLACELCGEQTGEAKMLVCGDDYGHGCDRGFHFDCLRPPLTSLPPNAWFCSTCTHVLTNGLSGTAGLERDPIADDTRLVDEAVRLGRTRSKTMLAKDDANTFLVEKIVKMRTDAADVS